MYSDVDVGRELRLVRNGWDRMLCVICRQPLSLIESLCLLWLEGRFVSF